MIQLIIQQQYLAFVLVFFALVFSLTFHEYGHAKAAAMIGDDTAARAGRLTINPIPHIHPLGLLMVLLIGVGFAKPVPTNPGKFNTRHGILLVAAAGPAMNGLLALVLINIYGLGLKLGMPIFQTEVAAFFFYYLVLINLLLMLFNLLPVGPLDGSYILPYALPQNMRWKYFQLNQRYGMYLLLGLIVLNLLGVPVLEGLLRFGHVLIDIFRFI